MISRRKLFGVLAGGAVMASELLLPRRSIFLPPRGGWPRWKVAELFVPREDVGFYAEGIASGRFSYDSSSQMMALLQPDIGHVNGKFHSRSGRVYDWADVDATGRRATIDDRLEKPSPVKTRKSESIREADGSNPALWLPNTWTPEDEYANFGPPEVIRRLKTDAVQLGIPFVAGTDKIDLEAWYGTDHYKRWQAARV